MRIALVHDWLTCMRGGEKCLEALCRLWPHAHLYVLLHQRGSVSPTIERMQIRTSFLQQIPGVFQSYRYFLPLMPIAIERFNLDGYDLVLSLSHCVAKSVRVPHGVPHVCYCFTPMRYAWHQRAAYFRERPSSFSSLIVSPVRNLFLADLRRWDRATSGRVTQFIAISGTVRRRIAECYGRSSAIIYPPVDTQYFSRAPVPREDFYLCLSALVPYKRIDLAIQACQRLGRRLVVIGTGPEQQRLRKLGAPSVTFLGWQPDEVIRDHYRRCRALLFPGEEDFGIVPLEAQACAAPVIAYNAGGSAETVIAATASRPGTGLLFSDQSVTSLCEALAEFESGRMQFSEPLAQCNAERFSGARFAEQMRAFVEGIESASRRVAA
jgi:glycosyltransferase involved in cell wall biosynthesis